MVHDLLSCKHIGGSIEKGLTKSVKQTSLLVSRGEGVSAAGGGGQVASLPFQYSLSGSDAFLSCVICMFCSFSLFFEFQFFFFFEQSAVFPAPPSLPFLFHGLGSGQPEQWLYQTYLQACSFIWALEKEAPSPETSV